MCQSLAGFLLLLSLVVCLENADGQIIYMLELNEQTCIIDTDPEPLASYARPSCSLFLDDVGTRSLFLDDVGPF